MLFACLLQNEALSPHQVMISCKRWQNRKLYYVYMGEPKRTMEARGAGGSGYLSRWREDGWGERAGWGVTATMTVYEFNEQNFRKWRNLYLSCRKKNQTSGKRTQWPTELMIVVLCVGAIRWGKLSKVSRPSYSDQRLKVPFLTAFCCQGFLWNEVSSYSIRSIKKGQDY